MKTITKERIIKALKKVDTLRLEEVEAGGQVIKAMVNLGLESAVSSAFDKDLPGLSIAKMGLELAYLEQSRDPRKLKEVMVRWQTDLDYRDRFREAVYALQAKAGISGLERGSYLLGGEEFPCRTESEDLRLIESDLEGLSQEVYDLFNHWKDYAAACGLELWFFHRERMDWLPAQLNQVARAAFDADWAIVGESKVYWSQAELNSEGRASLRRESEGEDDQMEHEINLTLGKGLDRSAAECCLEFCASNNKPAI